MRRPILLLLVASEACRAPVLPPEPGWIETPTLALGDAGHDPDGNGTDLGACCHSLRLHGCYEGVAKQNGQTCYEHLLSLESVGIPIPALCVASATSAEAIRACRVDGGVGLTFRCLQ